MIGKNKARIFFAPIPLMMSNLRKFCQFCLIILVTAVGISLISPQLLEQRRLAILPPLQPLSNPTPERAWGETGATALPIAAQVMAFRNHGGVKLSAAQKSYLQPLFGNLTDRVRIVYQAKLLDRWSQNGKETHFGEVDSAAQTYCNTIYVRAPFKSRDTDQLVLLAHEFTHAQQCTLYGGISGFGKQYFQGYYRGGQTYQANPLEKSAIAMEAKFTRQLCNSVSCPPRSGRYYVNYKGLGINVPIKLNS